MSQIGAPRRSLAFLSLKPAGAGTCPALSYAALSSDATCAKLSFTWLHDSGLGMSRPSTMYFDVSSSAAASPSVIQHQPRLNRTSSSTILLPSSGGSSQYFFARSDTWSGGVFESLATASCCAITNAVTSAGCSLTILGWPIQNERWR